MALIAAGLPIPDWRRGRARLRFAQAALILLAVLGGLGGGYALALRGAELFLTARGFYGHADVIVVLGGDGPVRARQAARLWREGIAPRVLVTGAGDCRDIRDWMMQDGVPETQIALECASVSTWENASFSAPLLAGMGVRRAVLVTSWFHSRRAITCFQALVPDIQWMSSPAEAKMTFRALLFDVEGWQVFKEYPKTLGYQLRILFLQATGGPPVADDDAVVE